MTLEEVAEAAQKAYRRYYGEDTAIASDLLEARWTEDVAAGLCLLLKVKLHGVVTNALWGAQMKKDLVGPICEALLAEALGFTGGSNGA